MEKIPRRCEEIHVFCGKAERTGTIMERRSLRRGQRTCTSVRDLVRKYNLYGDGYFYLAFGHWPADERELVLDNVKWVGGARAFQEQRRS